MPDQLTGLLLYFIAPLVSLLSLGGLIAGLMWVIGAVGTSISGSKDKRRKKRELRDADPFEPPAKRSRKMAPESSAKVAPEKDQWSGSAVPVDPVDCMCGCGMWGRPLKSYDGHVSTCGCGTCHGIRRRNRERAKDVVNRQAREGEGR